MDTNFVLIPAQFGVDIYAEIGRIIDGGYELYILDKTLTELDDIIENGKGAAKPHAKLALAILEAKKPKTLKTTSKDYVDNIILGLKGYIVATQDKELKLKLKKNGVQVIVLRQKKYLMLD